MFHQTLTQVIVVQLLLMLLLFLVVLFPVLRAGVRSSAASDILGAYSRVRKLAPLTEDEVIAEFLRNEFHHLEFRDYRERLAHLVEQPDLASPQQNALRRALLFIRRGAMWRELPPDTQWYEVELTARDLGRIRVFPRAQWRRIAQGSFYLNSIVERIRAESGNHSGDEFFDKLRLLTTLVGDKDLNQSVLLIGVDETGPLTILDGNHRMTAAALVARSAALKQFRFICGFSPRMTECCWYHTNMTTLWRYAKNLVRYMPYDPETDIGRFLQTGS